MRKIIKSNWSFLQIWNKFKYEFCETSNSLRGVLELLKISRISTKMQKKYDESEYALRSSATRRVTSQFSILMLYIDHHMHIMFILAFCCDPGNLKQLKDPRRELEVSQNSYLNLFQIWKEDQFDFNFFLSNYFQ